MQREKEGEYYKEWEKQEDMVSLCDLQSCGIKPALSRLFDGTKGWFPLRKISITSNWTFFRLVLSTPPDQKKLKILQLFIIQGCGSQVQTGTENWYQKPMCGFNFVLIRRNPMLIFLSTGNWP